MQPANAREPMFVTLLGIVSTFRLLWFWNAASAIAVTGRPFMAPGMATLPPGPEYPVMVMPPFLVV